MNKIKCLYAIRNNEKKIKDKVSIDYRCLLRLVIMLILHTGHSNFEEAHRVYPLNDM
jgi:hypothetical protein